MAETEMGRVGDREDRKLPLLEDIMQLAMRGEIQQIQKLIDEGKAKADQKDHEGITPLHWAAINNHYALCKFLIERGADVNAIGGEAVATPSMWATQRCHYYIVNLFLQHGANPYLVDGEGYNILHLATFDGNVFLLTLLLHQGIPVDCPDRQGHTSLMWAAYKGYPAVVDLLLSWGASCGVTDQDGFTALHWALVKGNYGCIQKLIQAGSDLSAQTSSGKTPATAADDMGSTRAWRKALKASNFNEDAVPVTRYPYFPFLRSRNFLQGAYFLFPFVFLPSLFALFSKSSVFVSVPTVFVLVFASQWAGQQLLLSTPTNLKNIHHTPYLAGIFAASLFWVGARFFSNIMQVTFSSSKLYNIFFMLSFGLCTYFYIFAMLEDPGYVPKSSSRAQQKAIIEELLSLWKYDDANYCVHCNVRMPVRSRHCRRCGRCVAKYDHHCPWIHNCVATNNIRHFDLYVIALAVGIILFLRLAWIYFGLLSAPKDPTCNILPTWICSYILRDTFTFIVSIWSAVQLVWVTMLLLVQMVQVARGVTTFESMKGGMHHKAPLTEAILAPAIAGTTSMDGAQMTAGSAGPNPALASAHRREGPRKEGCLSQWKKLLGLDAFIATARGRAGARRKGNPFSRGIVTNCRDFWCDPAPVFRRRENGAAMLDGEAVNYTRMYEIPPRMKSRRIRQGEDGGRYQSLGTDDEV